jgi:hypothetical protein
MGTDVVAYIDLQPFRAIKLYRHAIFTLDFSITIGISINDESLPDISVDIRDLRHADVCAIIVARSSKPHKHALHSKGHLSVTDC